MKRIFKLLLLPLIVLDVLANIIVGESWRNTLSASAHMHKNRKYWGWAEGFIDALFFLQVAHCKAQADREKLYGSVWAAWWATIRGAPPPQPAQ